MPKAKKKKRTNSEKQSKTAKQTGKSKRVNYIKVLYDVNFWKAKIEETPEAKSKKDKAVSERAFYVLWKRGDKKDNTGKTKKLTKKPGAPEIGSLRICSLPF